MLCNLNKVIPSEQGLEHLYTLFNLEGTASQKYSTLIQKFSAFAHRKGASKEDSADIAIEVTLRLVRVNPPPTTVKYVYSALHNAVIDWHRRSENLNSSLENEEFSSLETSTPSRVIELRLAVEDVMKRMRDEYREPLKLCDMLELTAEEAASILNITVPALKSRLYRGRKEFANLYNRPDVEPLLRHEQVIRPEVARITHKPDYSDFEQFLRSLGVSLSLWRELLNPLFNYERRIGSTRTVTTTPQRAPNSIKIERKSVQNIIRSLYQQRYGSPNTKVCELVSFLSDEIRISMNSAEKVLSGRRYLSLEKVNILAQRFPTYQSDLSLLLNPNHRTLRSVKDNEKRSRANKRVDFIRLIASSISELGGLKPYQVVSRIFGVADSYSKELLRGDSFVDGSQIIRVKELLADYGISGEQHSLLLDSFLSEAAKTNPGVLLRGSRLSQIDLILLANNLAPQSMSYNEKISFMATLLNMKPSAFKKTIATGGQLELQGAQKIAQNLIELEDSFIARKIDISIFFHEETYLRRTLQGRGREGLIIYRKFAAASGSTVQIEDFNTDLDRSSLRRLATTSLGDTCYIFSRFGEAWLEPKRLNELRKVIYQILAKEVRQSTRASIVKTLHLESDQAIRKGWQIKDSSVVDHLIVLIRNSSELSCLFKNLEDDELRFVFLRRSSF